MSDRDILAVLGLLLPHVFWAAIVLSAWFGLKQMIKEAIVEASLEIEKRNLRIQERVEQAEKRYDDTGVAKIRKHITLD